MGLVVSVSSERLFLCILMPVIRNTADHCVSVQLHQPVHLRCQVRSGQAHLAGSVSMQEHGGASAVASTHRRVTIATDQSCAPTNWWSAAALGGLMTGGGGGDGVRPDERELKQRSRWTGFFSGFTGVSHFTCDLHWAASVEKLTVNMHDVHNFTVLVS